MNILNLPEWNVLGTEPEENPRDYIVVAEPVEKLTQCSECDSEHIYKHGVRFPLFYHLPMHYKRVAIRAKLQRYKCRACNHVGTQKAPNVHEKHDATIPLVRRVEEMSLAFTFAHIARETGLDERTVGTIFKDYAKRLKKGKKFETPSVLGIDEIFIGRTYRLVLTNVGEKTIYGIYKSRQLEAVKEVLEGIPNKKMIQVVTMDMWGSYKTAVHEILGPGIPIIADKFHVLRTANDALETCRKSLKIKPIKEDRDEADLRVSQRRNLLTARRRQLDGDSFIKLESYLSEHPLLRAAYDSKEEFFDFYESKDRKEAGERFFKWQFGLVPEIVPFFQPLLSKLKNWEEEVFNYFGLPVTNAFTESINNCIRTVERPGRGYSFESLKTKVLYTYGFKRMKLPKVTKSFDPNRWTLTSVNDEWGGDLEMEEVNFGVPISTFFEAYERGDF